MAKRILKVALIALVVVMAVVVSYVLYVFLSFNRLPDNLQLTVENPVSGRISQGEEYRLVSWNIGFGAYEQDYDFFMDGGKQSWAKSREDLDGNLKDIAEVISEQGADLYLIQEVDFDSTRSYHFNESEYLIGALPDFTFVTARNWDSAFLLYPLTRPHGKSRSGIMTFSSFEITDALRRSLPLEDSFMKLIDLDRCYSISRIPSKDGRELVLFNLHLSAYTSDGTIAFEQLKMLLEDMQKEYENGNWCIAGGDFNKDVVGGGPRLFGVDGSTMNWAQPIPERIFEGFDVTLVGPYDEDNPVPSCRNADSPYWEGQYQVTVDGFMVTPNVKVLSSSVIDTSFLYSDHNPVLLRFVLQ